MAMPAGRSFARNSTRSLHDALVYTAEQDPLCYPGTTVLINKADIRNQDELDEFELAMFLTRAEEEWPEGTLDYAHYRDLHHHFFQDLYEWAGQARAIRIGKGGNWFCYPEYIDAQMEQVFAFLHAQERFENATPEDFARGVAHVLAEINAIHPFREGNGRMQLTLLAILADNAGHPFDMDVIVRERVLEAMIASFSGDESSLANLIEDVIRARE